MKALEWLLLTYKMPPEPARKRISVWRKLKGMGAVYMQGGVCLLPKSDDHLRRLKMLENEIAEMEGEAVLFTAAGLDPRQEEKIIRRFNSDRDEEYGELISKCEAYEQEIAEETRVRHFTYAELEENEQEFAKFKTWFAKIEKNDFYTAPRANEARDWLVRCEGILDAYAHNVFAAQEENVGGVARKSDGA
ncbi:chromate resistance protein ChrB [Mesorhizobium qingshengii]|uniref:Chromate resistance protein ChrB n=1 Tax=Mesorhizobium qingshengii TaxID=1165689 RepID=A0ABT4QXW2_9HYPH|nr:Chromate resistance protein ChrB [Mesorhizobium qingshengii]MCZ8546392.1 chromate resistance protein ChrB [Mesorhizobium qingshengii]